jgi:hypothetical protein
MAGVESTLWILGMLIAHEMQIPKGNMLCVATQEMLSVLGADTQSTFRIPTK